MNMVCYKKSQAHGEERGGEVRPGCLLPTLGECCHHAWAKISKCQGRSVFQTALNFVPVAQLVEGCASNTKVVGLIPT